MKYDKFIRKKFSFKGEEKIFPISPSFCILRSLRTTTAYLHSDAIFPQKSVLLRLRFSFEKYRLEFLLKLYVNHETNFIIPMNH